jgi:MoxR-like ATPase
MNTIPINTVIIVAVLIVVALAVIGWAVTQRRRSLKLQHRFGPEYNHAVNEFGDKTKAEAELTKREQRVARLNIIPITAADAARFSNAWSALQGRFVDNPKGVLAEADLLVRELMVKRGYPMGDFELRAADISVDHPGVVKNYRAAQAIAVRGERGEADTEELRKAVVHYHTLFDELLGVVPAKLASVPVVRGVPVRS